MTPKLDRLQAIAKKCSSDVHQAGSMLDTAWVANENCELLDQLENHLSGYAYNLVFRSLWESGASALMRFFDDQKNTESINSFIALMSDQSVRSEVETSMMSWPMVETTEEAKHETQNALNRITNLRAQYKSYHEDRIKVLRNSVLSHAQSQRRGNKPTFVDLHEAITIAERAADEMHRISTGSIRNIRDFRAIERRSARCLWKTLSYGLTLLPEEDSDPGPQPIPPKPRSTL